MKYIKPTDFLSVRELQSEYKRIEGEITDLLLTDASARTAAELNDKLQQALNAATRYLAGVNDKFAKKELSTAFKEGKDSVHEKPKLTAREADAILSAQGFRYSEKAFAKHTYIELQTATENAGKGLKSRVNGIIEGLRKTGKDSVYNVQQAILKDLQQNSVMYIEYANGTKQTLDSYAAMAARSARIESTNIGSIGRALQAGTDLVIMTTMPQCCKLCGAYQGKVYSISGKDKRFPALFKTVLKSGYALPHPNCRHEFIPYFAEAEDPADVERMIKQSRIKYDKNGKLADVRTQRDIELYQMWQAGNRQRNTELLEYNKMRAYYEAKKIDPPYATIGAFRRARRAQSENYRESRKEWAGQLEIEENEIVPLTAEKKYDNIETETVVQGENKIGEINYADSEFEHEIETVIHAQGFDGMPKVVGAEEFKQAMQRSSFYAERTYAADSQEQLDEYRNMLYNGKWYIDCSKGGAQYGQGMYCAARFEKGQYIIPNDNQIGWEMSDYIALNKKRGNEYFYVEGITLQPDAKIITIYNGNEDITNRYAKEYALKYVKSEDAKAVIRRMIHLQDEIDRQSNPKFVDKVDFGIVNNLHKELKNCFMSDVYGKEIAPLMDDAYVYAYKKDVGVLAAEMGYDAINAQGHGKSGSYTVILNRTKVIFNKGGSLYGN